MEFPTARNPTELEGARGGKIQLCGPDYSGFGGRSVYLHVGFFACQLLCGAFLAAIRLTVAVKGPTDLAFTLKHSKQLN